MPSETAMAVTAPAAPRNGKARGAPIFLLALFLGVAAHFAGFALFRVSLASVGAATPPAPYASYVRSSVKAQDSLREREAQLSDPARLYLPATPSRPLRDERALVRPLVVFAAVPANVTVNPDDFRLPAATTTTSPVDALRPRQWEVLSTLGQAANEAKPLERRGARLQVTRLAAPTAPAPSPATPAIVGSFNWPESKAPPAGEWKPASFMLFFDDKGLVGEPVLHKSTLNEPVDKYLREQLRLWFARHPQRAGSYEVVVGP